MRSSFLRFVAAVSTALFGMFAVPAAWGQGFPNSPIRIIVPAAAAGFTDVLARFVSQALSANIGQAVIVENKPGANGIIGVEYAAKSPPNGYTLLLGYTATMAINPALFGNKLPYDPVKDFAPIVMVASIPFVLATHSSVPAKTIKEIVALGKSKSGQLNYGSAGVGSFGHLSMELFKTSTGSDFTHVPYKGNGPAFAALLANEVQVMMVDVPSALPSIKNGRLHAIAVTSSKRNPLLPDVPTIVEAGLTGFESNVVFGFVAPAGTPKDIIRWLNAEMVKILKDPAFTQRFHTMSTEILYSTPEEYGEHIKAEIAKWTKVVKTSGIKPE
ncbi:MAG: tripartite tricarboxylate transporter substrate binding protein [Betaproteobacteria bacterium]|nr:MAG: tripartite tricarboxylate transporter substrate binding protein [Betaproteobacteria bacterium]